MTVKTITAVAWIVDSFPFWGRHFIPHHNLLGRKALLQQQLAHFFRSRGIKRIPYFIFHNDVSRPPSIGYNNRPTSWGIICVATPPQTSLLRSAYDIIACRLFAIDPPPLPELHVTVRKGKYPPLVPGGWGILP